MSSTVTLAVDYGTTQTVAVLAVPGRDPRSLLFDGLPLLPSAVFCDRSGVLHVGGDAERMAIDDFAAYEPNPKRHIDEPAILLGGREIATVDMIGAALHRVAVEARRVAGDLPGDVVLTHPATWGAVRRQVLLDAAARAGLARVQLVAEPVAAAAYYVNVLGRPVPGGRPLLVFDFGGGTLDVALVHLGQGGAAGFSVGGLVGVDDLGGVDIDNALGDYLRGAPSPATPDGWRLRRVVQGAKETLSRADRTQLRLPGEETSRDLTRAEVDQVITPMVARAVSVVTDLLGHSGVDPGRLAGVLLTGGSSRVPQVALALRTRLGVEPALVDQPEVVVARGALAIAAAQLPPQQVSSPPAVAASGPALPVAPDGLGGPGGPGGLGGPGGPGAPGSPAGPSWPAGPGSPGGFPQNATRSAPRRRRRRLWFVLAGVPVTLLLVCGLLAGVALVRNSAFYKRTEFAKSRVFRSEELREFARPWFHLFSRCFEAGSASGEHQPVEAVLCVIDDEDTTKEQVEKGLEPVASFSRYADLATRDAAIFTTTYPSSNDLPGDSGPHSGTLRFGTNGLYWDDQSRPVAADANWPEDQTPEDLLRWWNQGKR